MPTRSRNVRQRLIETATRLFAEQGVDNVSLREILKAAGVRHATAVQYHFGDRDGLLLSVLEDRHRAVDHRRDAMLDHARGAGRVDARLLAEILVRPLAAELDGEQGRLFLRVYAEMLVREQRVLTDDGTSIWRWRELARTAIPDIPDEVHPRYAAATYAAMTLARRAADPPHADDRLFVSRLIDVVGAMLAAPLSDETRRRLGERAARRPRSHPA